MPPKGVGGTLVAGGHPFLAEEVTDVLHEVIGLEFHQKLQAVFLRDEVFTKTGKWREPVSSNSINAPNFP